MALVTRNRPDSLARTLQSLSAQGVQPFEVVVSDDSSAEYFEASRRVALKYRCRHITGPRRGLYANRNMATLACTGTHVRTMDDDHEFPAGHIAACLRAIHASPNTVWVIGECHPGQEATSRPWECPPQLHPRGFSVPPRQGTQIWAIADGATIYPRQIFDRGLRFFDKFPFGAAYLEWGSRLHWLGYDIQHLADTFVIHHFNPITRSFSDPRCDAATQLFAGLCHSFIYQTSVRHRLLTLIEFPLTIGRLGPLGVYAAVDAIRAFTEQRREMSRRLGHTKGQR